MIDLIHTLMHQQHRLIIRAQQARSKRALAKGDRSALDAEAYIDTGIDLGLRDRLSLREEVRSDLARGADGEGCFGGHGDLFWPVCVGDNNWEDCLPSEKYGRHD